MQQHWVRQETYNRAGRLLEVLNNLMAAKPSNVTSAILTDYYNCKDIVTAFQTRSRVPFDTIIGIQETFKRHKMT